MFRSLLIAAVLLVLPAAAAAQARTYTIEQLMEADSLGGFAFSPDNSKLLFTSNRTGIANIYVMPAEGGEARPLTSSTTETVRSLGYFPHDERILFSSDQGGNERAHIYVRELDGTIRDTGARRVIATHGDTEALVRTLNESGVAAETLVTQYGEDD